MTMIIIGILAVVALPRFADQSTFETRGFADQTLATLHYARKTAVASGRNVCVSASSGGNTLTMTMASARGQPGACGGSDVANLVNPTAKWHAPPGVTYGSELSTIFGGNGMATAQNFTVVGDSTYTIVVESTGYVHCNPVSACE